MDAVSTCMHYFSILLPSLQPGSKGVVADTFSLRELLMHGSMSSRVLCEVM